MADTASLDRRETCRARLPPRAPRRDDVKALDLGKLNAFTDF
jgi:hypothetical protein